MHIKINGNMNTIFLTDNKCGTSNTNCHWTKEG